MRWASSTPAGTRTFTWRGCTATPLPRHVGHAFSTIIPRPPHCGQGWLNENGPWFSSTVPRPAQRGHTTGLVPGAAPVPWHREQVVSLVT